MLVYLGKGWRDYGNFPFPVASRPYWEFQAVLNGRIAPVLPNEKVDLKGDCLWVFPPFHLHGWIGDPAQNAEVAVFQYPVVPLALAEMVASGSYIQISLIPPLRNRLHELVNVAERHYNKPDPRSQLRHQHLLLELCLMTIENISVIDVQSSSPGSTSAVFRSIKWFEKNISLNPGLKEISRAAGVSAAHLRRLFHTAYGSSPSEILRRIKLYHAMEHMKKGNNTLEAIAEKCGYGSLSAFSRTFKKAMGCSPSYWQRGVSKDK